MSNDESSRCSSAEVGPTPASSNQIRTASALPHSETDSPLNEAESTTHSQNPPIRRPIYTIETEHLNVSLLSDGRKQVNQYTMMETLGKGTFAKVKLAVDFESGITYAVKIVNKALMKRKRVLGRSSVSDQLSNLRREIELMKMMDHDNIVKLYEIIDDPNQDKIYLVMEHLVCGPVINLQDENCIPLPENVCKSYLRDILSGLEYLHSQRIAHRDIKPDNLLVSQNGVVKIADFGVSLQFVDSNDYIRATAGSLAFMAPELCLSEGAVYSARKTDIWSAGISLYAMLFGKVPFTANSSSELYETISRAKLEWSRPISPAVETTLRGMLEKDPSKRITLAQLKEDPWLTDNGTHLFGAEYNQSNRIDITAHNDQIEDDESKSSRKRDASSRQFLLTMRTNSVASSHPLVAEPEESFSTFSLLNPIRRLFTWISVCNRFVLLCVRFLFAPDIVRPMFVQETTSFSYSPAGINSRCIIFLQPTKASAFLWTNRESMLVCYRITSFHHFMFEFYRWIGLMLNMNWNARNQHEHDVRRLALNTHDVECIRQKC